MNKQTLDLRTFSKDVHELAKEKGWHDATHHVNSDLENHMLIVSEIAEASENVRKGNPYFYMNNGKPEGEAVELADAIIRILDYAESQDMDLIGALLVKHEYNKTRPFRHGKVK